jgi:hypothetical protein
MQGLMQELDAEAAAPAAPAAALPRDDYSLCYYSKQDANTIGIKTKFGAKKQIFSFGGRRCTKTEEEMREIAMVIIADLNAGMPVLDAKKKGFRLAEID